VEHENLRAALEWCADNPDGGVSGQRLCGALHRFWSVRGYLGEGRRRYEAALNHAGGQEATQARADACNGAAGLALDQGDTDTARKLFEEGMAVGRAVGDRKTVANALTGLGNIAEDMKDDERKRILYAEALAMYRELGNRPGQAAILANLGNAAEQQGDFEGARLHYQEAFGLNEAIGNQHGMLYGFITLGGVALRQNDLTSAQSFFAQSIVLCRTLGDHFNTTYALENLAHVALQQRNPLRATRCYGAAQTLREQMGAPRTLGNQKRCDHNLIELRVALGDATFEREWAVGQTMTWKQAIEYALEDETP
jgi:non-specific serine/threonine protein kinase